MDLSLAHLFARRLPFYYGWVIALVVGLVNFSSVALGPPLLSIYFKDMATEFGWSRSVVSGAALAGSVLLFVVAPVSGRLLDKVGPRPVFTAIGLVMTVCLLALAGVQSLVMFYLAYGIGFVMFMSSVYLLMGGTVAKWFVRLRGRALAVSSVLLAMGFVVMPLMGSQVLAHWGWRAGWLAAAALVFVLTVPLSFLLLRSLPGDVGQRVDGDDPDTAAAHGGRGRRSAATEVQWTTSEALRTPTLWLLLVAVALLGFCFGGMTLHLVPHLSDRGMDVTYASLTFVLGGSVQLISSFAWGWLLDRIHIRYVFVLSVGTLALWGALVVTATANWQAFHIGVLQGVGFGGATMTIRIIFASYFGRVSAASVLGVGMPLHLLAQGMGAFMAGIAFDRSGSYVPIFTVYVALLVAASLVNLAVPTPRKRALTVGAA